MEDSSSYTPSVSFTSDCTRPPPYVPQIHRHVACDECQRKQAKLSEQLKDVTIMNDKWQKYNKERESYIKGLQREMRDTTKKVLETERLLNETRGELSQTRARETHSKKMLKDQQTTISSFGKLMDELEEKTQREQRLSGRNEELEQEVESMKRESSRRVDGSERVELLQQQLEVCIDDFRTEKREKEKYRDEARTLREKSEETENLLQDYQEKVAMIQSLQFPSVPSLVSRTPSKQSHPKRRSSVQPNKKTSPPKPHKPSSWSYPSDYFPSFSNFIEADCIEERGSQSDSALYDAEFVEGIPAKPLDQLCTAKPSSPQPEATTQNDLGSDSVFYRDQLELVRH